MNISLNGKWKLYYYDSIDKSVRHPDELVGIACIPCTVPGNVELDLSAAGILPEDLFKGENILQAEKYETYEWWYETQFDGVIARVGQKITLEFEGVDCIAEYYLNGELIGKSDNMLIPHEFDVTGKLKANNTLHVKISSAVLTENDMDSTAFAIRSPWKRQDWSTQIRKAPHSYGWDIFPRAISAGIWKSVSLKTYSDTYFKQAYFVTEEISDKNASVVFLYELQLAHRYYRSNLELEICGSCGDSTFEIKRKIEFKSGPVPFTIDNPKLWWPYGYGDANLYEINAKVYADGKVIAQHNTNAGIRTVELIRKDIIDNNENCFRFEINGEHVVCKGSNWVPLDAYHSRDAQRYEKALQMVKDIGCNILRCWGGNVYEQPYFYDFCDKNGIMIWQDFAMGCFIYPQTEQFQKVIANEAEVVIKMLRQHPSIILWSGDNECDLLLKKGISADPNVAYKLTRQVLPDMVITHDLCRPYLASSPFVSTDVFNSGSYKDIPENHLWGPRKYYKEDFYKNANAHFVSETGYHGAPSAESVRKFIDKEYVWPCKDNPQWILHSSDQHGNPDRVNLMVNQLRQMFAYEPDNLEEFCYYSQLSQAEAKKYFIERIRMMHPRTGGVIWWNLIDGWPQMSDAVVDYYYDKKIAYDYIKRSQSPFAIMMSENISTYHDVYAVNDTLEPKCGKCTITNGETGEVVLEKEYTLAPNSYKVIGRVEADFSQKALYIIKWDGGFNHFITGYPPFDKDKFKKWHEIIKNQ